MYGLQQLGLKGVRLYWRRFHLGDMSVVALDLDGMHEDLFTARGRSVLFIKWYCLKLLLMYIANDQAAVMRRRFKQFFLEHWKR